MTHLTFLGAAGTVTGSRHLLETRDWRVLVDCGLFQGQKELRLLNWEPPRPPLRNVDLIVLTHAHIDHIGYLPRLVREGFEGRILGTRATADLAAVLLRDAGRLQEEEARFHNRRGSSKHRPAQPLYTEEDGIAAAERIEGFDFDRPIEPMPGLQITFRQAGHILGSAFVVFEIDDGATGRRIVFSGDLGRRDGLLQLPPRSIGEADYVVMESTYGDRLHSDPKTESKNGTFLHSGPPYEQLERAVNGAIERGGALIIPAFAVARSQTLLYMLDTLERQGRIPSVPTFLDSPMAIDATDLYRRHASDLKSEIRDLLRNGQTPFRPRRFRLSRSPEESKQINSLQGPAIIVSASGMATGGRVLHHLSERLGRPETTVLLAGYQVPGTRGWRLQKGERQLRIFGRHIPVKARIETLTGLSAHGDQQDLIDWIRTCRHPPEQTFLVHGEVRALDGLKSRIEDDLGWPVKIPARGQTFRLRD